MAAKRVVPTSMDIRPLSNLISKIRLLVCLITSPDQADHGQENDLDIEPERPVFDVVTVHSHTIFHILKISCLSAVSKTLRQSGDPRLYVVTTHETINQSAVLLCVS